MLEERIKELEGLLREVYNTHEYAVSKRCGLSAAQVYRIHKALGGE